MMLPQRLQRWETGKNVRVIEESGRTTTIHPVLRFTNRVEQAFTPRAKRFTNRVEQAFTSRAKRFTTRVEQAFRPAAKPLKTAGLQPRFVFPQLRDAAG